MYMADLLLESLATLHAEGQKTRKITQITTCADQMLLSIFSGHHSCTQANLSTMVHAARKYKGTYYLSPAGCT